MLRSLATFGAVAILAFSSAVSTASAEPDSGPEAGYGAANSQSPSGTDVVASAIASAAQPVPEGGGPVVAACGQFGRSLDLAAVNYEDFAYAIAGRGNAVDYRDENVKRNNVIGRTALREAAYGALSASRTPGLPPEVAEPIRGWSLRATKLLVVMGLHGGGDILNSTADEMNSVAHDAQLACARHGGSPF